MPETHDQLLVLGPLRPLTGAASAEGPESDLTRLFADALRYRGGPIIVGLEVPLPTGTVDVLEVRLRSVAPRGFLEEARAQLADLPDRHLQSLSLMRPRQPYRRATLVARGVDDVVLDELVALQLLTETSTVYRDYLSAELIERIVVYELKVEKLFEGAIQAARRRRYANEAWVVVDRESFDRPSGRDFLDASRAMGVGVLQAGSGARLVEPETESRLGRWTKFLVARALGRGLA